MNRQELSNACAKSARDLLNVVDIVNGLSFRRDCNDIPGEAESGGWADMLDKALAGVEAARIELRFMQDQKALAAAERKAVYS